MAPIDFQDYLRDADIRAEAWRRKFEIDKTIVKAEPNKGHMAIAKLVDEGKASHVITQNIDNLHQLSGVPTGRSSNCMATGPMRSVSTARLATNSTGCVNNMTRR